MNRPDPLNATVRDAMRSQARRDTRPELALRQELHRRGRRFRLQVPVPGAPRRSIDIAFPRARVAVMVDGCFWHGCPEHLVWPRNNAPWWHDKLVTNIARDLHTDHLLVEHGWIIVRLWEHTPVTCAADLVEAALVLTESVPRRLR